MDNKICGFIPLYHIHTCQLSRILRETPAFYLNVTHSRITSRNSRIYEKRMFNIVNYRKFHKDVIIRIVISAFIQYDIIWGFLSKFRFFVGQLVFPKLSKVAKLVPLIPHPNTGEECFPWLGKTEMTSGIHSFSQVHSYIF